MEVLTCRDLATKDWREDVHGVPVLSVAYSRLQQENQTIQTPAD